MMAHETINSFYIKVLTTTSFTKMKWNLICIVYVNRHFVAAIPTDDSLRGWLSAHVMASMLWAHRGNCIKRAECDLVGNIAYFDVIVEMWRLRFTKAF